MKLIFTVILVLLTGLAYAQTVPVQEPVEERHQISYWWWILGVLIALGVGIVIYMLIKKDPRRDAVR